MSVNALNVVFLTWSEVTSAAAVRRHHLPVVAPDLRLAVVEVENVLDGWIPFL